MKYGKHLAKPVLDNDADEEFVHAMKEARYLAHCHAIATILAAGLQSRHGGDAIKTMVDFYVEIAGCSMIDNNNDKEEQTEP